MDFLYFLSSNESDSLDGESDDDGSESGSAGTCDFTFCFEDSVGSVDDSVVSVRGMGSGIFVPIGIDYNCDVVTLVMFIPI